jgi:predicted hydrolase (HD superfamily)
MFLIINAQIVKKYFKKKIEASVKERESVRVCENEK